jgi:hypothetical protein
MLHAVPSEPDSFQVDSGLKNPEPTPQIIRRVDPLTTNNGDITNYIGLMASPAGTCKRKILGA